MPITTPVYPSGDAPLLFMNGTTSDSSYLVVAQRGSIFLGIKPLGLMDGSQMGIPKATYLHARVRSVRHPGLAKQLDQGASGNVVSLSEKQLGVATAWPALLFEKVDEVRASLVIGAFIQGSLTDDPAAVADHIEHGPVLEKLADYVMEQAGSSNCIISTKAVAAWLRSQAIPLLKSLKEVAQHQNALKASQQAFATMAESELETVAPHGQLFHAIYTQHQSTSQEKP